MSAIAALVYAHRLANNARKHRLELNLALVLLLARADTTSLLLTTVEVDETVQRRDDRASDSESPETSRSLVRLLGRDGSKLVHLGRVSLAVMKQGVSECDR